MLTHLAQLATNVLSLGELWPSITVRNALPPVPKPLVTPGEPSTLALGLIGIATVGIYLAVSGLRRSRGNVDLETQSRPTSSAQGQSNETQRRPTRGAA